MMSYSTLSEGARALLRNNLAVAFAAAAIALSPIAAPPAHAADQAPSAADQQCLGCHGFAGMEKKADDGDVLQLHVPADISPKTVHAVLTRLRCK